MFASKRQIVIAALMMVVLATGCVFSCLGASASAPAHQRDAHACCHKASGHAQNHSQPPSRDCHNVKFDVAQSFPLLPPLASGSIVAPALVPPSLVRSGASSVFPVYSPPDILSLNHVLLI